MCWKLVSRNKHVCNAPILSSHFSYILQEQVIEGRSGRDKDRVHPITRQCNIKMILKLSFWCCFKSLYFSQYSNEWESVSTSLWWQSKPWFYFSLIKIAFYFFIPEDYSQIWSCLLMETASHFEHFTFKCRLHSGMFSAPLSFFSNLQDNWGNFPFFVAVRHFFLSDLKDRNKFQQNITGCNEMFMKFYQVML